MKVIRTICAAMMFVCLGACVHLEPFQTIENGVRFTAEGNNISIVFYGDSTVKVEKQPVADRNNSKKPLDLVVVQAPSPVSYKVKRAENLVRLSSSRILVEANLNSGSITFRSLTGEVLLEEQPHSTNIIPIDDAGESSYRVKQSFSLQDDEAIFGLGQVQNGKLSQRGQTIRLVQNNTEDFVPFIFSEKGYGVYWDNYSPTTFTDSNLETSFDSEVGEAVRYYFMHGKGADGTVALMRELTGQVPMLPMWTYGYWQSKERYKSQTETLEVVENYRRLGIPLDGIIQDWQYWGDNYHWNAMAFLNPQFPQPQELVDDVHSLNARIIISIWSSFGPKTPQYPLLNDMDALFNFETWPQSAKEVWPPDMNYPSGVKVYDAFNPKARDLYWEFLDKGLFSLGIDGWWMDSTEPDHFNVKPDDMNEQTYLGSFRKVRNAYPLMTVGGVYTHQRTQDESKRVFILTRSAFAGQQRYASQVWSGDVVASWENLAKQITAGLNFSLTGIPYWNSDIGGFFLWDFPQKLNDPEYKELYVRWLQFGAFTPMMRSHGADAPREIYQFGDSGTPYYDAIEKFIKLRYRLLPYIYSTSWQVSADQSTFMRAHVMDFPNDSRAVEDGSQYMFGNSFLVKPVTAPMYSKKTDEKRTTPSVADFSKAGKVQVYLPEGNSWYDFWTNQKLNGGQLIEKLTPMDIMPLYVKSGSIIPWGPEVQYAEEKTWQELTIKVYSGNDGEFVLYEDEGDNYKYESGKYSTINFHWDEQLRTLTIDKRNGEYDGLLRNRVFNIELINGDTAVEQAVKTVSYQGDSVSIAF